MTKESIKKLSAKAIEITGGTNIKSHIGKLILYSYVFFINSTPKHKI